MNLNESALNRRYRRFREQLVMRFWDFQKKHFQNKDELFERLFDSDNPNRPPVFKRKHGAYNVLVSETLSDKTKNEILAMIFDMEWHRWFPSMASSQALAQSVFGNLTVLDKLDCLASLIGDDGKPLFIRGTHYPGQLKMEHVIMYLGETNRKTHIDVFMGGDFQVAVECKLSEREFGSCSRPNLRQKDPSYSEQYCTGRYTNQMARDKRCSLTQIGIKYWEHIPWFFSWDPNIDHDPCPLNDTYQLVRNVLAAGLRPAEGNHDLENPKLAYGHAVLVYDERNPEFLEGGTGWEAWKKTKAGLKKGKEDLLQKCTWQQILSAMKKEPALSWLVEMLHEKYGF